MANRITAEAEAEVSAGAPAEPAEPASDAATPSARATPEEVVTKR
jgi:hypothetical protein